MEWFSKCDWSLESGRSSVGFVHSLALKFKACARSEFNIQI